VEMRKGQEIPKGGMKEGRGKKEGESWEKELGVINLHCKILLTILCRKESLLEAV